MKSTRKSLLASGLALLASVALLAGTTFAWFTDSVTNSGNKIQAGSLKINAYAFDLAADGTDSFTIEGVNGGEAFAFEATPQDLKKDTSPIINDKLFEPGKSNAKLLKVENAGTLAAKIKLDFTVNDGGLMDALWFDFVRVEKGEVKGEFTRRPMNELETIADGLELPLLKDENVQFILVYGMDESAGNTFMNKTFTADVTILAAQYTEEKDGFGNDRYDAAARYAWDGVSVDTDWYEQDTGATSYQLDTPEAVAGLASLITEGNSFAGKTIELTSDINLGGKPWPSINASKGQLKDAVIDGNGHTIENLYVSTYTVASGGKPYGGGFIGNINSGITIKDLTFDHACAELVSGDALAGNIVGIVLGYANGTTILENVSVTNSTVKGYGKVGVMVGMGNVGVHLTFKNCTSVGNTIQANYDAGGLAGNIQRQNGVDHTVIEDCRVENNTFDLYPDGGTYVKLVDQTAAFTDNDLTTGEEKPAILNGTYLDDGEYYWAAKAELYCSYGNSKYDAPITTPGEHSGKRIANSEKCIDTVEDIIR